jgi:hypothetical protein
MEINIERKVASHSPFSVFSSMMMKRFFLPEMPLGLKSLQKIILLGNPATQCNNTSKQKGHYILRGFRLKRTR